MNNDQWSSALLFLGGLLISGHSVTYTLGSMAAVEKLHGALREAMNNPEFGRVAKNAQIEVAHSDPAQLAKDIKTLDEQFALYVKELGLK